MGKRSLAVVQDSRGTKIVSIVGMQQLSTLALLL